MLFSNDAVSKGSPNVERIAQYIFDDDFPSKTVSLCTAGSLVNLSNLIQPSSAHFVLLLALDATTLDTGLVYAAAEKLLAKGMVYICVWGPDGERVEDIFDKAIIERNPNETDKNVVITTCHNKEPLSEAVWFFLNCAWPADDYVHACSDWVAAVIGNPAWEAEVRAKLLAEKEESESP
jgi:hypothetical protein